MKNMTIGKKITLGFALVIVLMCVMGAFSYKSAHDSADGFGQYREAALDNTLTGRIQANILSMRLGALGYFNTGDAKYIQTFNTRRQEVESFFVDSETHIVRPARVQMMNDVKALFARYVEDFGKVQALIARREVMVNGPEGFNSLGPKAQDRITQVLETARQAGDAETVTLAANARKSLLDMRLDVNKFLNLNSTTLERAAREAGDAYLADLRTLGAAGLSAAEKMAYDEALSFSQKYIGTFDDFVKLAYARNALIEDCNAAGPKMAALIEDLKLDIKAEQDEIGPRMARYLKSAQITIILFSAATTAVACVLALLIVRSIVKILSRIIGNLDNASSQTAAASSQVASSSQALAEGASEAASSIEETTASVEEMSAMTRQNAANAAEASALTTQVRQSADKGNEAMGRMSGAIDDIKQSSDETKKILKNIDEIAFQTNLLALNAAVEAARAGEAGKGFAVVAEEVRNLAQRSAEAARSTATLVEQAVTNSDKGVVISAEVAEALGEITGNVDKATGLVGEIAAASDEQAKGVEQISQALTQLDTVTQANASTAEQSASASEELSGQAVELASMVEMLQKLAGNKTAGAGEKKQSRAAAGKKVATLSPSDRSYHQIAESPSVETADESELIKF